MGKQRSLESRSMPSSNHQIRAFADAAVKTEVSKSSDVTSILTRSMESTAVQTITNLGADSRIPEPSKPFSWADDAASIPVFCRNPPRDVVRTAGLGAE